MIPYDDLVAALSAWRTRQGLPVNQVGGSGSGPTASPGSGPNKAGSGPNKAPPVPPSSSRPNLPVAAAEEPMEVADELLDDASYENEGNDFAMSFGQQGANSDATAIGEAPERPTEADLGNDKDDW